MDLLCLPHGYILQRVTYVLLPTSATHLHTYMPRALAVYCSNKVVPLAHTERDVVASQSLPPRIRTLPRLSSYDSMTNQRNIKSVRGHE